MRGFMCLSVLLMVMLGLLTACFPAAAPQAPVSTPASASATPAAMATTKSATAAPAQPSATALAPAGENPKYGGVLITGLNGDPPNLDLHQTSTYTVMLPIGPVYNGLLRFDPFNETKIIPDLAETWKVATDGKTIDFTLKTGVKWHDGTPFTSADVKATLERHVSPPKGVIIPRGEWWKNVQSVEAPSPTTVKVTLKRPQAFLISAITSDWTKMYAKHVMEQKDTKKDIIGTGPFTFVDYKRGVSLDTKKNPNYFVPGKPYLDGQKYYVIPDYTTMAAAMRIGRVHMTPHTTPVALALSLAKEPHILSTPFPILNVSVMFMNTTRPPFDNPKLRAAVALTLDRDEINKLVYHGYAKTGGIMHPDGLWDLPKEDLMKVPGYATGAGKDAEREQAKKLVVEAGYPRGVDVVINQRREEGAERADVLKSQLQKIGIRATVQVLESTVYYERNDSRNFDLTIFNGAITLDDPDDAFAQFYVGGSLRNASGYSSKEVERLYEEQSSTVDNEKRKALVYQMSKIALSENYSVPLFWRPGTSGRWDYVKGWNPHRTILHNRMFDQVWLDK